MMKEHKRLTAGFFRSVNSPELFKQFFDRFGAWEGLSLKEKPKNDDIFAAWDFSPHPKRPEMKEELCCMNDIACEDGRAYILSAAEVTKLPNYQDLTLHQMTMRLWLNHPKHFAEVYELFQVEKTDSLKILKGEAPVPCNPDKADLERFAKGLQQILRKGSEGPRLKLEPGPKTDDKYVLVVPHEHFMKPDSIFKDEKTIVTKERRPVYEMVLIYYPKKGLLKLKVGGKGLTKAEAVGLIFGTELLHKKSGHFKATEIISFEPLFRSDFSFPRRPTDEFEWAKVVYVNYTDKRNKTFVHTIKCTNTLSGIQDVTDQLKKYGVTSYTDIEVKSIALQFYFKNGGRKKNKTVVLTRPYSYNLDETPRDLHVEEALSRWGFIKLGAHEHVTTTVA